MHAGGYPSPLTLVQRRFDPTLEGPGIERADHSAANQPSPVDAPSLGETFDGGLDAVSADSLIAFLAVRLDELDDGIRKEITAVENQGEMSNAISMKRELLDAIASAIRLETKDPSKKIELSSLTVTWNGRSMSADQAINLAGLYGDVAFTDPEGSGRTSDASKVSLENIESASSKLEKEQKRLTSDNDLRMLRLQDGMNRRSQVIQMVSAFLRSIQDSHRVIVGNMR
jgi:hypothetical protein